MKLTQVLSRTTSQDDLILRKHTPWISGPLEHPERQKYFPPGGQEELKQPGTRVLEFREPHQHRAASELPTFKHHHESSTVELFYDLFFVANLTTFTSNHEINDGDSLKNYIGFFTILWFTWLETSLFDVRFSSDSVFNRICKAISFGVMTGFAITGAVYDTSSSQAIVENVKAFRAMSLILMVSRLTLVLQYGFVLWYVRHYKQTMLPLAATMASLFVSAVIFLGTFWGFPFGDVEESFPIESSHKTYIAWYVVVCAEALAVIAISCVWRVVSFKHTHLVERIGLLTLIIMGEGIIGITKSVSVILQKSSQVTGSTIGIVTASVLLIYFIWVLYFDQIEHDRFGTIRQQIWAILHYPLHVTILLTVEGASKLIQWNVIYQVDDLLYSWYPTDWDEQPYNFKYWGYNNTQQIVETIKTGIRNVTANFKDADLLESYNTNITAIQDVKAKFGSADYDNTVGQMVDNIWLSLERLIYNSFGIEAPETSRDNNGYSQSSALYNVFNTVFIYFFLAAGGFLFVLSVMYWFGKTHKSRGEWISIAVRAIFGIGLSLGALENSVGYYTTSVNFDFSPWPLVMVMLGFFIVIVLDNLLVWHTNKTISHQTSHNRNESFSLTDSLSRKDPSWEGDTPEESNAASQTHAV